MHMYIYPATHITYQDDANMINRSTLHLWEVGGGPLRLLRFQRQGFGQSTSKSWAKCARLRHKMGMGRKPVYNPIFIMFYTIYIYTYVYYMIPFMSGWGSLISYSGDHENTTSFDHSYVPLLRFWRKTGAMFPGTDQQEQRWDGGLHPFSDSSFWSSDASMVLQLFEK